MGLNYGSLYDEQVNSSQMSQLLKTLSITRIHLKCDSSRPCRTPDLTAKLVDSRPLETRHHRARRSLVGTRDHGFELFWNVILSYQIP